MDKIDRAMVATTWAIVLITFLVVCRIEGRLVELMGYVAFIPAGVELEIIMDNYDVVCDCGFVFAGPGELRNCEAFITAEGHSGVECPECGQEYIGGQPVDTKHDMRENNDE